MTSPNAEDEASRDRGTPRRSRSPLGGRGRGSRLVTRNNRGRDRFSGRPIEIEAAPEWGREVPEEFAKGRIALPAIVVPEPVKRRLCTACN